MAMLQHQPLTQHLSGEEHLACTQVACISHFQSEPLSFLAASQDVRGSCAGLPEPVLQHALQSLPEPAAAGAYCTLSFRFQA